MIRDSKILEIYLENKILQEIWEKKQKIGTMKNLMKLIELQEY